MTNVSGKFVIVIIIIIIIIIMELLNTICRFYQSKIFLGENYMRGNLDVVIKRKQNLIKINILYTFLGI